MPLSASECTKKLGRLWVPAPTGTVMLPLPAAVALGDSNTRVASALVIVTCRLPAGAGEPSAPNVLTCRSFPTATPERKRVIVLFVTCTSTLP